MPDNDTPQPNDPIAYNTALFQAHMESARLLAVKSAADDAKRPQPEPKPNKTRGLL